ncbi:6597_t:CDS:2 [Entrophospora sp. SA101]|nr:6597_t:CDS:2 [Entrophospora sp. SA101]
MLEITGSSTSLKVDKKKILYTTIEPELYEAALEKILAKKKELKNGMALALHKCMIL